MRTGTQEKTDDRQETKVVKAGKRGRLERTGKRTGYDGQTGEYRHAREARHKEEDRHA